MESRFESQGNPKIKLQACRLQNLKSLQSQNPHAARKRILLNGLEIVHERLLKLRVMKLGQDICGVMIRQSDYELIDEAAAQRVMRFLKVRRAAMAEAQNGSAAA